MNVSRAASIGKALFWIFCCPQTLVVSSLSLSIPSYDSLIQRRQSLQRIATVATGCTALLQALSVDSAVALERLQPTTPSDPSQRPVVRLGSGVQYGDVRIGHGRQIVFSRQVENDDMSAPSRVVGAGVVVLHLRALLRDGSILFDTRQDGEGNPILHRIGSLDESTVLGLPAAVSKVTLGVEEAILARGAAATTGDSRVIATTTSTTTTNTTTTTNVVAATPMREGGIRLAAVPAILAYGNAGVSRFDARFKYMLRQAVPRDEMIRYEIEILRCQHVSDDGTNDNTRQTVQLCCSEPEFPCKTAGPN